MQNELRSNSYGAVSYSRSSVRENDGIFLFYTGLGIFCSVLVSPRFACIFAIIKSPWKCVSNSVCLDTFIALCHNNIYKRKEQKKKRNKDIRRRNMRGMFFLCWGWLWICGGQPPVENTHKRLGDNEKSLQFMVDMKYFPFILIHTFI